MLPQIRSSGTPSFTGDQCCPSSPFASAPNHIVVSAQSHSRYQTRSLISESQNSHHPIPHILQPPTENRHISDRHSKPFSIELTETCEDRQIHFPLLPATLPLGTQQQARVASVTSNPATWSSESVISIHKKRSVSPSYIHRVRKRKYCTFILGEEAEWNCGKNGCEDEANIKHASELSASWGDERKQEVPFIALDLGIEVPFWTELDFFKDF